LGIISLKDVVRNIEKYEVENGSHTELESWVKITVRVLREVAGKLEKD
jgi:hypothetical protein